MQRNQNNTEIKVPVKQSDGTTVYEDLNQGGVQTDGSMWTRPIPMTDPNHEHYFEMKDPSSREASCKCGIGGSVYPHTTVIKNGRIYNMNGQLVV